MTKDAKAMNSRQSQGFVNLKKARLSELKELLERQDKILSNKQFINHLKDKGERIKIFKDKLLEEIKKRDAVDEASELLSKMALTSLPNEIEWSGKKALETRLMLDSDDDSDEDVDPLKLVATHSGTQKSIRRRKEEPSKLGINAKGIEGVNPFKARVPYADQLCEKYDRVKVPDRFKPNEPRQKELSKTGYKSSSENVQKAMGKNWEVTAATPPIPVHGCASRVSLAESLALQREKAQLLKEFQMQDAMARLQQTTGVKLESSASVHRFLQYRNPVDPTRLFDGTPAPLEDNAEDGCIDDDHVEAGVAVFYNIVDDTLDNT